MRIPVIALLLTTLSGAIACTVVNTTTPNPNATNNNSKTDGGSNGDGGGSDGGTAAGTANAGSITLSQTKTEIANQTSFSYSIIASFAKVEGATTGGTPGTNPCKTTTEGSCSVQECDLAQAGGGGGGAEAGTAKIVNVSAGDITVKATEELTLSPDKDNKYELKSGATELFAGGADINVKAKGATIPAFDQTLKAPSTFTLTTPTVPAAGQKVAVDSAAAFDFEWTDGTEGNINATLMTMKTGEKSVTITCSFPAKDNKGTVPAAAVAKLIKGATIGTFSTGALSSTVTKAGDWNVTISASAGGPAGQIDVQ